MEERRIVLVATRHWYDSYGDFRDLARLSGFDTCYVDEIRLDAPCTYITTPINGEYRPHIFNEQQRVPPHLRRAKLVWWYLERSDATGQPPVKAVVDSIYDFIDAAWVSDRSVATLDPRFQYVVLGGHPGLRIDDAQAAPEYDFAHVSYAWGRREGLYKRLERLGLKMAPPHFGMQRHETLIRSKVMLNAQQYPMAVIAPLRFALAAAYKLAVVSEAPADPYPHRPGVDIEVAGFDDLPRLVIDLARGSQERRQALGEALYRTLCEEWTFRRGVEEGLAAVKWLH